MSLFDLSIPDEISVSDALVVELPTFEPRLSDAVVVTDALAINYDSSISLADAIAVSDSVAAVIITLEPVLSDTIVVTDVVERLWVKGQLVITSIVPERGEPGDVVAINGTGFDASGNTVEFSTIAASVFLSESPTQILVEVPSTFRGFHVPVKVTRADGRFDQIEFWVDETLDVLKTFRLPQQLPGFNEDQNTEAPGFAEAQDIERVAVLAEFLWHDLLRDPGVLHTHDGTQMAVLPDGTLGHTLVADSALAEGIGFKPVYELSIALGLEIPAAVTSFIGLIMNGDKDQAFTSGFRFDCPFAGTIDRLWLLVKNAGVTDTLDQVRIAINTITVHDSGAGLGLGNNGSYRPSLALVVAQGDEIVVSARNPGTTDDIGLVGGLRINAAP